jgi:hypothetical protein
LRVGSTVCQMAENSDEELVAWKVALTADLKAFQTAGHLAYTMAAWKGSQLAACLDDSSAG